MVKILRALFLLLALTLLFLAVWVLPGVKYDSDVMALFPQDNRRPEITAANELLAEGVTDKLFFLLSSADWQATQRAASTFAETLQLCQCIDQVSAQQNAGAFMELRQYYFRHAPVLLSEKDRVLLQQGKGEALITAALRDITANPNAASTRNLLRDPLTTVEDYVADLRDRVAGQGVLENDYLYFADPRADRRYLLVVAELTDSPYALAAQQATDSVIKAAVQSFKDAVPDADVIRTGAYFYTRAGTEQALQEISTVGAGSLIGVMVILLMVFRSAWLLFLALLPIAAGVVAGLSATALVFGNVHVMALMFGASLVGVSIDYSLHFLCKRQAMGRAWDPRTGLRNLMPGLTLGLLTSVAGYFSFVAAGFPGLQQVAVFSCAGLIAAYLVVAGGYTWILQTPGNTWAPRFARERIPRYLAGAYEHLRRIRHPELLMPLLLISAVGLWRLEPLDDVRAMQLPDARLQEEETRFQELVGSVTAMQYLLVQADNQELLLQKLEQLQQSLRDIKTTGAIADFSSLSHWLPSQRTQQENNELLRLQLVAPGLFQEYLEQLGVDVETRATIIQSYLQPVDEWLTLEKTVPQLHHLLKRPLYFSHEAKHYSFILLDGLRDDGPVQALADANQNVYWVDRVATTSGLLEQYRHSASWVLAGAYVVILLLLMTRYGWRGAVAVIAPPLLASICAVVVLGWLGIGLSVFNIMALLLVLGIGLDYTLFLRESAGRGYDTLFAIGLSTATTLLSFGLLSLSATHAIFSFGLTTLLGIGVSFLLAPLAISARNLPPDAFRAY